MDVSDESDLESRKCSESDDEDFSVLFTPTKSNFFHYFEKYVNDQVIEDFVKNTNENYREKNARDLGLTSRELRCFNGIELELTDTRKASKVKPDEEREIVSKKFTVEKFQQILSSFRHVSQEEIIENDYTSHARKLARHICEVSKNLTPKSKKFCLSKFSTFGRDNRTGIFYLFLCDRKGVLQELLFPEDNVIFTGYPKDLLLLSEQQRKDRTEAVVNVCKRVSRKSRSEEFIYLDPSLTSVDVVSKLLLSGLYACGLSTEKDDYYKFWYPKENQVMLDVDCSRQQLLENGNIALIQWRRQQYDYVFSVSSLRRKYTKKTLITPTTDSWGDNAPNVIFEDYTETMEGCRKFELHLYSCSMCFDPALPEVSIIMHMLNVAIVNSFILMESEYYQRGEPFIEFSCYRLAVLNYLTSFINDQPKKIVKCAGRLKPLVTLPERFDLQEHWPDFSNQANTSPCAHNPKYHHTRVKCLKCGVYLCLQKHRNCFIKYHQSPWCKHPK